MDAVIASLAMAGQVLAQETSGLTGNIGTGLAAIGYGLGAIGSAIGVGMVLSALLYVNESSIDISVVEMVSRADGRIEERRPPDHLPSREVTVLDVHGQVFFAGARTLERLLPTPQGSQSPVVILRLRGRSRIGATLIDVLSQYAAHLRDVDGTLYLVGLSPKVRHQLTRANKLHASGRVKLYPSTPVLGDSILEAREDARAWLAERHPDDKTLRRPG